MTETPALGAWTPADGPLVRRQSQSPTTVLVIGVILVVAAVGLGAAIGTHLDRLPGREIGFALFALLMLALGGLGVAVLVTFPRTRAARLVIGPDGIAATHVQTQAWAWAELEQVVVEVLLRREVLEPVPRALRTQVWIQVLIQPLPEAVARRSAAGTLPKPPAWRPPGSDRDFAYLIRMSGPLVTAGRNLPIVRDLNGALLAYGGPRYLGVQERLRLRP